VSGERPRRVAEAIQRFLSTHISSLRDPRLGFCTVTGVEVSRDLKNARVFVTIFEQDAAKKSEAMRALNGAAGLMRRELGRGLRLRYAPALIFQEDVSIATADRIERLIRDTHSEDTDAAGGPGADAQAEDRDDAPADDRDESK
jgi:ribosome-binding factor A